MPHGVVGVELLVNRRGVVLKPITLPICSPSTFAGSVVPLAWSAPVFTVRELLGVADHVFAEHVQGPPRRVPLLLAGELEAREKISDVDRHCH